MRDRLNLITYFQAVKKLLLQWHPDKNIDRGEEAKVLFQHLQKEMKRCEKGKQSYSVSQYQDDGPNKKPADEIEGNFVYFKSWAGGGVWGLGTKGIISK